MKSVSVDGDALPSNRMVKRQHLRDFQAKNGWEGAPVLEFEFLQFDRQSRPLTANPSIGPGA